MNINLNEAGAAVDAVNKLTGNRYGGVINSKFLGMLILKLLVPVILMIAFFAGSNATKGISKEASRAFDLKKTDAMTDVVTGKITSYTDYTAEVTYKVNGKNYTITFDEICDDEDIGEEVNLVYNPDNPSEAAFYLTDSQAAMNRFIFLLPYIFLGLAILMIVIIGLILFFGFKKAIKNNNAYKEEHSYEQKE